ncbi:uncharacterized protein MKZ38_005530 [Zalerion maritima]|uniref:Nuclear segregation protein n=1 Tax=Zalerion maritima TaxID=339359 RepID=A0AAD5RW19_9PEZI|nr:uncharacterized protein MKZ38_005530 [Zalerion maritima]
MSEPTSTTTAATAARPSKPDENAYKEKLVQAQKEHDATRAEMADIKGKIDIATGNKDNSPNAKRRQELMTERNEIRTKQGGAKNARMTKMEQVKKLDEQMRSRMAEQKAARGKMEFKSEADLDAEIKRLDDEVNSGRMKLVDEKKALDNISRYRKLKKNFGQFTSQQKEIDEFKAKIAEIKKSMDNPEAKSLNERYDEIQKELDVLKAEQDVAYKSINSLRDERTRLQNIQREQFEGIKKLKDEHFGAKRAYKKYEDDIWEMRKKRKDEERQKQKQEEKMARAKAMLADASDPAYLEEIHRAENLWHFFDPSHEVEKKAIVSDKGLGATAQRTVDDSAFKGMKVVRKQDEDLDYLPAVKKGKKGKKSQSASAASSKFKCPPSIMEDCEFLGIPVPMSQTEVPRTIEEIKKKLETWHADQDAQTQKNIDKAKKEIERLEAAEDGKSSGKDVDETAEKMKDTSLEDKKEEVAA